jgi:hypothetical protein
MLIYNRLADFLSAYNEPVPGRALKVRELILATLPGIIEQLDLPAKMIAYCYGQKYAELVCTLIPSQKGLKLGFNQGTRLPDPAGLLEGAGKISRYVVIKSDGQAADPALRNLLLAALVAYKERVGTK